MEDCTIIPDHSGGGDWIREVVVIPIPSATCGTHNVPTHQFVLGIVQRHADDHSPGELNESDDL